MWIRIVNKFANVQNFTQKNVTKVKIFQKVSGGPGATF